MKKHKLARLKVKHHLPKLFLDIIANDAKLEKTLDAAVIPMDAATKQIKEKRQLIRYAKHIYEGDPDRYKRK